jgi:hypothetical protein
MPLSYPTAAAFLSGRNPQSSRTLAEVVTSPQSVPTHHTSHHDLAPQENTHTPAPHSQKPLHSQPFTFIFRVFSPKIACQAPNPLNRFRIKNIRMAR